MEEGEFYHKYLKYKNKYDNLISARSKNYQIAGKKINTSENTIPRMTKVDANNLFAVNMFENLDGASNIFSPFGILFALSLINLAALGNTSDQLTKLLNYNYSTDDLEIFYKIFNNDTIKITNLLLINKKYQVDKSYSNMIDNMAIIVSGDFDDNSTLIVNKTNSYIETRTNGMIKSLVDKEDIQSSTIFVLINTIYFKAAWEHKFDMNNTTKMKFHKTNIVDMMHQIDYFTYYENNTIQAIEIPYEENNYVMGIILPKRYLEEDEMNYTVNDAPIISFPEIMEIINNMSYTRLDLYLPKFTQRKNLELIPVLKKMGVTDLFDHRAVLGISGNIFVSKIIHEAVVIVDEIGTEASAATSINVKMMAMSPRDEPEPKLFKADHAFIYYIRHVLSGLFLFYGDYQGS